MINIYKFIQAGSTMSADISPDVSSALRTQTHSSTSSSSMTDPIGQKKVASRHPAGTSANVRIDGKENQHCPHESVPIPVSVGTFATSLVRASLLGSRNTPRGSMQQEAGAASSSLQIHQAYLDQLRELSSLRRQVETSQARDATLRIDLERALRECAILAESQHSTADELAQLRAQVGIASKASAKDAAEIASLRVERDVAQRDRAAMIAALEMELEKERTRLTELAERAQRRSKEDEAARKTAESALREHKANNQDDLDRLNRLVSTLRGEILTLKEARISAERSRDAMENKMVTERTKMEENRRTIEEQLRHEAERTYQVDIERLEGQVQSLQHQLEQCDVRYHQRNEQLTLQITSRESELKAERDKSHATIMGLHAELEEARLNLSKEHADATQWVRERARTRAEVRMMIHRLRLCC